MLTGGLVAFRLGLLRETLERFRGDLIAGGTVLCRFCDAWMVRDWFDGCGGGAFEVVGACAMWDFARVTVVPCFDRGAKAAVGCLPNCFVGKDGSLVVNRDETGREGPSEDTHS